MLYSVCFSGNDCLLQSFLFFSHFDCVCSVNVAVVCRKLLSGIFAVLYVLLTFPCVFVLCAEIACVCVCRCMLVRVAAAAAALEVCAVATCGIPLLKIKWRKKKIHGRSVLSN